ncbi:hypothetical protein B9G39_23115 [Zooshikella ganghwensis]|uniref:Uncharacterized protein n=1 Tax=Zooshikella ganghwensis TaxID=202772 RepID=A0A4P9VSJ5_9GAMM|nr:hypothetical protein B9G39_23115 [Zooshikella ganghwensis]
MIWPFWINTPLEVSMPFALDIKYNIQRLYTQSEGFLGGWLTTVKLAIAALIEIKSASWAVK